MDLKIEIIESFKIVEHRCKNFWLLWLKESSLDLYYEAVTLLLELSSRWWSWLTIVQRPCPQLYILLSHLLSQGFFLTRYRCHSFKSLHRLPRCRFYSKGSLTETINSLSNDYRNEVVVVSIRLVSVTYTHTITYVR